MPNPDLSSALWISLLSAGNTTAVDSTAPTLSSAAGAVTSGSAASGSVTTDEGNGTLYWVATTALTSPSAAQVKAGQDHTGAAATASGNQAVSGTGAQSLSGGITGLTNGTTQYYVHYMHEDAATNQSDVASIAIAWNPLGFGTALEAWFKADTGITLNGSDVSAWADQSGNGCDLTQGTAAAQPAYNATGFNGLPTIDWVRANDEALASADTALALGAATASFFIVGQLLTGASTNAAAVSFLEDGDANDWNSAGSARALCQNNDLEAITAFASGAAKGSGATTFATDYRMGVIFNGTNVIPYVNNVAGTGSAAYSTAFGATGRLTVGTDAEQTAGWEGPISEVVVTSSALAEAARNLLDAYFVAKWNL